MAGNSNSGRKATPTKLKLVEGKNYRMSDRANEPVPAGDLCDPPAHLNERQLVIWSYAIEHAPHGLLKKLDQAVLMAWCVAQSIHEEATKALNNGPTIIKTPNGMPIQSPWLGIINKQAIIMRSLVSELGFSPTSRTRISIEQDEEDDDITAKYFR
jgi:P27 family predicted phage terminase small subunit